MYWSLREHATEQAFRVSLSVSLQAGLRRKKERWQVQNTLILKISIRNRDMKSAGSLNVRIVTSE
jgi:hypothetical protein